MFCLVERTKTKTVSHIFMNPMPHMIEIIVKTQMGNFNTKPKKTAKTQSRINPLPTYKFAMQTTQNVFYTNNGVSEFMSSRSAFFMGYKMVIDLALEYDIASNGILLTF